MLLRMLMHASTDWSARMREMRRMYMNWFLFAGLGWTSLKPNVWQHPHQQESVEDWEEHASLLPASGRAVVIHSMSFVIYG